MKTMELCTYTWDRAMESLPHQPRL
uniref:Uncharacterized protein n=1 Tax=Timema douglasi TaxID=61478 RepID=A0A7R8VXC4_TIMDO|nr:unnamed protein product [Timema douglasi]